MPLVKTLMGKIVWVMARGAVLGMSLAAVFPTEGLKAACDCHDAGAGQYSCKTGDASSCSAGTESCYVTCS
jgi:hypothetical protein